MGHKYDNAPHRALATERANEALKLRIAGYREREIAERLGVTVSAVSKMLTRALDKTRESIRERTEELRAIEVERLDELIISLWPRAVGIDADLLVVDRILKIAKRRAELLGLDIPVKEIPPDITDAKEFILRLTPTDDQT